MGVTGRDSSSALPTKRPDKSMRLRSATSFPIEGHGRIGSHRDEDDLRIVEAVPQPEVPSANAADPSPPYRFTLRFVVGGFR